MYLYGTCLLETIVYTFTCVRRVNVHKPTKWEDELVEEREKILITIGKLGCCYVGLNWIQNRGQRPQITLIIPISVCSIDSQDMHSISKIWNDNQHRLQGGCHLSCYHWRHPTMQMPGLHQNVLSNFGKEKDMGKLQTSLIHVQISIQDGLYQWQIHSRPNVYLQWGHVTPWVGQCCRVRIMMLFWSLPYCFELWGRVIICMETYLVAHKMIWNIVSNNNIWRKVFSTCTW